MGEVFIREKKDKSVACRYGDTEKKESMPHGT